MEPTHHHNHLITFLSSLVLVILTVYSKRFKNVYVWKAVRVVNE